MSGLTAFFEKVEKTMTKFYEEDQRERTQFELQLAAAAERKKQVYGLAGINAWLPDPVPQGLDPSRIAVTVPEGRAFKTAWLNGHSITCGYGFCVTCGLETPVDAVGMRGGQGYCAKHLHTFDSYVGIKLDGVWEERCVSCGGPRGLTECKPDPDWRARHETALAKGGVGVTRGHYHGWPTPAAPPLDDYQPLWSRVLVCPLFVP